MAEPANVFEARTAGCRMTLTSFWTKRRIDFQLSRLPRSYYRSKQHAGGSPLWQQFSLGRTWHRFASVDRSWRRNWRTNARRIGTSFSAHPLNPLAPAGASWGKGARISAPHCRGLWGFWLITKSALKWPEHRAQPRPKGNATTSSRRRWAFLGLRFYQKGTFLANGSYSL